MNKIEGLIIIHFVVDADNARALRFEALITWSAEKWKDPVVRIRQEGRFINVD